MPPIRTRRSGTCLVSAFNVIGYGVFVTTKKRIFLKGQFGFGDVWTWTALCPDTKLVPCWLIDGRSAEYVSKFMSDLAGRLADRVQLTTDGHTNYIEAVWDALGNDIDYAMLEKIYSIHQPAPKLGIV